jgi:ring-1,2-phenylacetyl-CoA epoxidase subunit PaaD
VERSATRQDGATPTSSAGCAPLHPPYEEIRRWLGDVPDPEIPSVSVVDLGIVRAVEWRGDELVVTVTPTYSGCPATAVIALDIENALRARGLDRVRVESRLAPPWTTDWISAEGRRKLATAGIAPPAEGACPGAGAAPVACPHCGSAKTERVSQFGSTPCKAQYRCTDCLEPFDHFKRF